MNHRREAWVVIGRDVGNRAGLLSPGISLRLGGTHKPEYRRHLPLSAKRAKIFARSSWLSVLYAVRREVASKGFDCAFCCLWIILHKGVTIERRDLRLLRRSRCFGFGVDDAFDCSKHPFSDIFVESTHVQLDNCLIRNHI